MIQIPHNLLMPLAGGLAVVAVGVGVYIGRATAQPAALLPPSPPPPHPPAPGFIMDFWLSQPALSLVTWP